MLDRRTLATGVFAVLVAMSYVLAGGAQGQGAGAPQAPGAGAPQTPGAGAPQTPGAGAPQAPGVERGRRQGRAEPAPGGRRCRRGPGAEAARIRPPAGSKELKDVLYNWTWHMGMLRSGAESELIKTLDYYGASGIIQVNGQPCTLTKYHLQANYQIPGYRIDIGCTRANKQTYYDRREHERGLRVGRRHPGRGTRGRQGQVDATAQTRSWSGGFVSGPARTALPKAALAAAAGMHPLQSFGQNPATLLDRQAAAGVKGTTTLTWEKGREGCPHVPRPGRSGCDGDGDARQLPARARGGDEREGHDRVRLR